MSDIEFLPIDADLCTSPSASIPPQPPLENGSFPPTPITSARRRATRGMRPTSRGRRATRRRQNQPAFNSTAASATAAGRTHPVPPFPVRILIVEPDLEARTLLKYTLRRAGFEPHLCPRAIDLWVLLCSTDADRIMQQFEFAIVNLELLNETMRHVVQELKARGTCPPILLVASTFNKRTQTTIAQLEPVAIFDDPFDARRQLAAIQRLRRKEEPEARSQESGVGSPTTER